MNCKNQLVTTITKFVNGGYGFTHDNDGTALFARFGLPGERVTIDVTERKKKASFGHVVKVDKPHPNRITPPCPYYGRCGGCDLQHVSYDHQCELKQRIITELISAAADDSVKKSATGIKPTQKSPAAMHYRQRIRLAIDKQGNLGFKRFRSNSIVAIESCLLAVQPINRCLQQLKTNRSFRNLTTVSEQVELSYNPLDQNISALFSLVRTPRPTDRKNGRDLTRAIDELGRVFFCGHQFALEGPHTDNDKQHHRLTGFNLDADRPLTLRWEVGGFSQVNLDQNKEMINLVTRLSDPWPEDRILDLFCGMGNFTLPLALKAAEVYGIESQGSAIRSGKRNCSENRITNCHFEKSDVESACRRLMEENRQFDIVICDPPRRGLAELIPYLASLTTRKLIYISCDPATLCRDLAALTESGLAITSIHPVDMFPQTHHIETVVSMEKRC